VSAQEWTSGAGGMGLEGMDKVGAAIGEDWEFHSPLCAEQVHVEGWLECRGGVNLNPPVGMQDSRWQSAPNRQRRLEECERAPRGEATSSATNHAQNQCRDKKHSH